jgi:hypothetical protein
MQIFSGALILFIIITGTFSLTFGEMITNVGVARGDVFRYGYTCYFNSNDPTAVPPAAFSSINQTDYFMINVTGVSGMGINFNTMLRGLNGPSSLGVCSMNIANGVTSISGYGGPSGASRFYFMANNVGMMGRMFPSVVSSPTINDTLMMPYAGGSRLTNHFVTSTTQNGVTTNSDYYFDQKTGMMVQWREETIQTSGTTQTNSTQRMQITSSSEWTIPEFPTALVAPIFIVAGVISLLALLGKAKFKRIRTENLGSAVFSH